MENTNPEKTLAETQPIALEKADGEKVTEQNDEQKQPENVDFVCTPYEFSSSTGKEVDYNKLIEQFGTRPITQELLQTLEKITGKQSHVYLRRGNYELTQESSFPIETWLPTSSSSKRRNQFSFTQGEGHHLTRCTWATCFLSYLQNGCKKPSSVLWSFN